MPVPCKAEEVPTAKARGNAASYIVSEFYKFSMSDIDNGLMKKYLSKNYTIAVGMRVDKTFQLNSDYNNIQFEKKNGKLVWTEYKEIIHYGHAMLLCGYDDNIGAYKVMNSWGENWGEKGFFWIDYNFFKLAISQTPLLKPEAYVGIMKRPNISTVEINSITSSSAQSGAYNFFR